MRYILLIILSALALIAVIPIRLFIRINADEREITLKYSFLKIRIYPPLQKKPKRQKKPKNSEPEEEEKEAKKRDLKGIFKFFTDIKSDIYQLLKKTLSYMLQHAVRFRELNISAVFGTGDPADTGMLCGAVYGGVYNAIAIIKAKCRLDKYEININPDFDNAILKAGVFLSIQTRIAHFIIILFIILRYIIKIGIHYLKARKENANG